MWADIESRALKKGFKRPVGVDEVGRGPLAGPVVAGACYLPKHVKVEGLKDSKQLMPEIRAEIYELLVGHPDVDLGIGFVLPTLIDEMNILHASLYAMKLAIGALKIQPDYLIIDGNRPPKGTDIVCDPIVKADEKIRSVAAASVVAKVYRDEIMIKMHELYPEYGFNQNMGYSTKEHLDAIEKFGPCPIHRRSFTRIKEALGPNG